MFGSVSEWLYRWLGGIRPDPEYPGFERYIVDPCLPAGLDFVNCTYHSPLGVIVSNWKKEGADKQVYTIVVPGGSSALVRLPACEDQIATLTEKSGRKSPAPVREGINRLRFELGPGEYTILISKE